jgi:C-terminal processing protease CtpA/Prc
MVRRAAAQVRRRYIFPDRGEGAAAALERRLAEGAYAGLDEPALCVTLTDDLRQVCPDRHLRVVYHADEHPERDGDEWDDPDLIAEYWEAARTQNHGVYRVERLDGNVGYLDLRAIDEAEETAGALTAAMTLVRYTNALLVDLRQNTGGSPTGVAFLCSHFFAPEPVHLNDVHEREKVQQFWTYPYVPGPRYLDRPVFVLTGDMTFSGGEEIVYNLQQLKRATVIGETTRGGAHPVGQFWVGPRISIRVPVARSVNPVSGTNWEGVGVIPDVPTPPDRTWPEAYRLALRAVLDTVDADGSAALRDVRQEAAEALERLAAETEDVSAGSR